MNFRFAYEFASILAQLELGLLRDIAELSHRLLIWPAQGAAPLAPDNDKSALEALCVGKPATLSWTSVRCPHL